MQHWSCRGFIADDQVTSCSKTCKYNAFAEHPDLYIVLLRSPHWTNWP